MHFPFLLLFLCLFSLRLCSLTLKKLVVLKELDKELNSLSIAVKIQVSGLLVLVLWGMQTQQCKKFDSSISMTGTVCCLDDNKTCY